jgi:hypothetical protein
MKGGNRMEKEKVKFRDLSGWLKLVIMVSWIQLGIIGVVVFLVLLGILMNALFSLIP